MEKCTPVFFNRGRRGKRGKNLPLFFIFGTVNYNLIVFF